MSHTDHVRVGLIGAGFIGGYHVDGIRAAGFGDVTVLVGRDVERAARRAIELDIPRSTLDVDAVIADADIDAVVIATPDATHKPLAIAALQAGKNVLLQKPMAMSSQECRDIIAAAEASDAHLSVSFMHRYFPEVRWLRARLAEGAFGDVHAVRMRNATPGAGWSDWFFDPAMVAGGVVMQLGVHGIDLLQYLFGPIESVTAISETRKPVVELADGRSATMPFEDNVAALYRFATGLTCSHEISWTEVAGCDRFRLEVYCEAATVWLRAEGALARINEGDDWQPIELKPEPLGQAHHAHWLDVIAGRAPPDDTAEAGLSTSIVAEHIYRAARDRTTLSIGL